MISIRTNSRPHPAGGPRLGAALAVGTLGLVAACAVYQVEAGAPRASLPARAVATTASAPPAVPAQASRDGGASQPGTVTSKTPARVRGGRPGWRDTTGRPAPRPRTDGATEGRAAAEVIPGGTAAKLSVVPARITRARELPGLAGRIQYHTVTRGEDLLIISRNAGIGFRALRDANPRIDEWEPKPGTNLVVPTQWILPRSSQRGLVINVAELRLYKYPLDGRPGEVVSVLTWPVGAGDAEWPTPIGGFTVTSKDENPTWVVPASILRKMERPRAVVPPGPDNPLGAYRIRLSLESYLLHGTNDPWSVGRLTTHGCVRLYPEDIADLYQLVDRGMPGEFVYEPVKVGEHDGRIYIEVHRDIYQQVSDLATHAERVVDREGVAGRVDPERVRAAVEAQSGIPVDVTREPATRAGAPAPIARTSAAR